MGYIVEFEIFLLNVDYYVIFVFRKEDKMDWDFGKSSLLFVSFI